MLRAMILALATLASTLASTAAVSATTDVVRETEGFGLTQQEALTNALVEAVRQVRGTAAGIDRGVEQSMGMIAGAAGSAVFETTSKPVQDIYTESRGFVRSYEVIEMRNNGATFHVRIRAVVPNFESAVKDDGKSRIAIMPFRIADGGFALANHGDAVTFSRRLADTLLSQLAAEPSVVVINRDFFIELGLEKAVLGADAAPEELTKLGSAVGADFLLVGRIQEARTESEPGPYGTAARITDEIRLSWRLVEAATGKIARAGDIAFDNRRTPRIDSYGGNARNDFEAGEMIAALAKKIGAAALEKPAETAPAAAVDSTPAALTPGSSDKPFSW